MITGDLGQLAAGDWDELLVEDNDDEEWRTGRRRRRTIGAR